MLPRQFFQDSTKPHMDRHPYDVAPLPKTQRVRVDGGGSNSDPRRRVYVTILTGYGEKQRAENARRRYDRECIAEARGK
jgi:hypothetical protein